MSLMQAHVPEWPAPAVSDSPIAPPPKPRTQLSAARPLGVGGKWSRRAHRQCG